MKSKIRYHEYTNSPRWEERKRNFRRSKSFRGGSCFVCTNSRIQVHIHHRSYDRLGNEWNRDLRVLCAVCHAAAHERGEVKMRAKFYPHASRNNLWGLRNSDPVAFAREVAKFWGVTDHPFVVRVLSLRPKPYFAPVKGVSKQEIHAARGPNGGWTKEWLESKGVPCPPPRGWKRALIRAHKTGRPVRHWG